LVDVDVVGGVGVVVFIDDVGGVGVDIGGGVGVVVSVVGVVVVWRRCCCYDGYCC